MSQSFDNIYKEKKKKKLSSGSDTDHLVFQQAPAVLQLPEETSVAIINDTSVG